MSSMVHANRGTKNLDSTIVPMKGRITKFSSKTTIKKRTTLSFLSTKTLQRVQSPVWLCASVPGGRRWGRGWRGRCWNEGVWTHQSIEAEMRSLDTRVLGLGKASTMWHTHPWGLASIFPNLTSVILSQSWDHVNYEFPNCALLRWDNYRFVEQARCRRRASELSAMLQDTETF